MEVINIVENGKNTPQIDFAKYSNLYTGYEIEFQTSTSIRILASVFDVDSEHNNGKSIRSERIQIMHQLYPNDASVLPCTNLSLRKINGKRPSRKIYNGLFKNRLFRSTKT